MKIFFLNTWNSTTLFFFAWQVFFPQKLRKTLTSNLIAAINDVGQRDFAAASTCASDTCRMWNLLHTLASEGLRRSRLELELPPVEPHVTLGPWDMANRLMDMDVDGNWGQFEFNLGMAATLLTFRWNTMPTTLPFFRYFLWTFWNHNPPKPPQDASNIAWLLGSILQMPLLSQALPSPVRGSFLWPWWGHEIL